MLLTYIMVLTRRADSAVSVALRFRNELAIGDAEGLQVFAANHAFTEARIVARAAGNNHHRRQAAMVKLGRVVQPRFVDRRRTAVILSRAEHDDCVRRARLVTAPPGSRCANRRPPHSRPAPAPEATAAISSNALLPFRSAQPNRRTQPDRFQESRLAAEW